MTSLEHTLANVLVSIERAKVDGDSRTLKGLLERKRVICEALGAPEQSWLEPQVQASSRGAHPRVSSEKVLELALCV